MINKLSALLLPEYMPEPALFSGDQTRLADKLVHAFFMQGVYYLKQAVYALKDSKHSEYNKSMELVDTFWNASRILKGEGITALEEMF